MGTSAAPAGAAMAAQRMAPVMLNHLHLLLVEFSLTVAPVLLFSHLQCGGASCCTIWVEVLMQPAKIRGKAGCGCRGRSSSRPVAAAMTGWEAALTIVAAVVKVQAAAAAAPAGL